MSVISKCDARRRHFAARSHARISANPASRAATQNLVDFTGTLYSPIGGAHLSRSALSRCIGQLGWGATSAEYLDLPKRASLADIGSLRIPVIRGMGVTEYLGRVVPITRP